MQARPAGEPCSPTHPPLLPRPAAPVPLPRPPPPAPRSLGRKKKRDKIFGGAKMQSLAAKDATITFKDIAGVDQVLINDSTLF